MRRYGADGGEGWTQQFGSANGSPLLTEARGVAADESGVYLADGVIGDLPGRTSASPGLPLGDIFVRKYDLAGTERWTHQFGTSTSDQANGVAVSATGIYVAAFIGSESGPQALLRAYDRTAATPTVLWSSQFNAGGNSQGRGGAVHGSGVCLAGQTNGALPGQTSSGGTDAFLRKYNLSGTALWTLQFGSLGADMAHGVAVDPSGMYAVGQTSGTLPGQTSSGSVDAFVTRINDVLCPVPLIAECTGASGASVSFAPTVTSGAAA